MTTIPGVAGAACVHLDLGELQATDGIERHAPRARAVLDDGRDVDLTGVVTGLLTGREIAYDRTDPGTGVRERLLGAERIALLIGPGHVPVFLDPGVLPEIACTVSGQRWSVRWLGDRLHWSPT